VAFTPEPSDQDFIVLVDEVEAAVVRDESCDFFAVLLEEYTDALTDGRVRLLGLHSDLLYDDPFSVRSSHERLTELASLMTLLVVFVSPSLCTALDPKLAACSDSTRLAYAHFLPFIKLLLEDQAVLEASG
jgi:hypothetical protein